MAETEKAGEPDGYVYEELAEIDAQMEGLDERRATGEARAISRFFHGGLGLFLLSFSIWVTDITGVLCDPANHLVTGHAVWHVLNAISVALLGLFYQRRFAISAAA